MTAGFLALFVMTFLIVRVLNSPCGVNEERGKKMYQISSFIAVCNTKMTYINTNFFRKVLVHSWRENSLCLASLCWSFLVAFSPLTPPGTRFPPQPVSWLVPLLPPSLPSLACKLPQLPMSEPPMLPERVWTLPSVLPSMPVPLWVCPSLVSVSLFWAFSIWSSKIWPLWLVLVLVLLALPCLPVSVVVSLPRYAIL